MSTTAATFFGLLFTSILTLLAGVGLTRLYWRPDIPPHGRRTRFLDVAVRPEAYVKDAPLRAIRLLNLAGGLLVASAAAVIVYEALIARIMR